MKVLFVHGWNSALPNDSDEAVRIAQAEFDRVKPDVVVGSSRGGAVTINLRTGDTPLVLLCPAWRRWGTAKTVKSNTRVLELAKMAETEV